MRPLVREKLRFFYAALANGIFSPHTNMSGGGETEVMVSFSFPLISRPGDAKCFALSSGVITYIIFFAKSTPVPFIPLSRLREKVLRAKVGKET